MGRAARYSIYDGKTTLPVMVYATRDEAMKLLGISTPGSFRTYCYRIRKGLVKKWDIIKETEETDYDS